MNGLVRLNRVYVGFDPREGEAYDICEHSLRRHAKDALYTYPLRLKALAAAGKMYRIRDPLQSTDFTYSRFLVPHLAGSGWALFMDCDILVRGDIGELFALANPKCAAMVVKHEHKPATTLKMGAARQTVYPKKNWSSVVLWNCDHPKNRLDWVRAANEKPASWLHQFGWLDESDIGSLPVRFNYLVGHNTKEEEPERERLTYGDRHLQRTADGAR
jgi:hypothetical protein